MRAKASRRTTNRSASWSARRDVPSCSSPTRARAAPAEEGFYAAFELGFGEPVAISAEHGEGLSDLEAEMLAALGLKPCYETGRGGGGGAGYRTADPRRHRRAAERRQVDAGQRVARRRAHDHRTRAGPDARQRAERYRVVRAQGAPVRHRRVCGARRRSPRRPRSSAPATPSAPSALPRWSCC